VIGCWDPHRTLDSKPAVSRGRDLPSSRGNAVREYKRRGAIEDVCSSVSARGRDACRIGMLSIDEHCNDSFHVMTVSPCPFDSRHEDSFPQSCVPGRLFSSCTQTPSEIAIDATSDDRKPDSAHPVRVFGFARNRAARVVVVLCGPPTRAARLLVNFWMDHRSCSPRCRRGSPGSRQADCWPSSIPTSAACTPRGPDSTLKLSIWPLW
jgi:hypothetical protein